MINNCSNGNNKGNSYKENNNNEENIDKKYEKSKKIWNEIQNSNILEYDQLFDINEKNNKSYIIQNSFFLINRVWFKKFKKFCESKKPFQQFVFPGTIDNGKIIIQDNSALKLSSYTRIFFNNNYIFDEYCIFIEKKIWNKIRDIYGGGPEYEITHMKDKNTNLIKEGVHINLIFIPNKINNVNDIKKNHFYFNLNRSIKDLREYIKKLINSKKEKFSLKKNNYHLEENKDYRLWLYSSFYDPNKDNNNKEPIENYLCEGICSYKNLDNSNANANKNKNVNNNNHMMIDWHKISIGNHSLKINLISYFDNNIIKDVFPNEYSNNFDWKEFLKFRYKDDYCLPMFTIIIEQAPFRFIDDGLEYKIDKCSKCKYTEIVYIACECKKLMFCSNKCKSDFKGNHLSKCKIALINEFRTKNKQFSEKKNSIKYSLKGLTNLGNTCYMNSALQCMRSIKELTDYFLNYFDESQLNLNNIIGTGGFLTLAYVNYLYNMNDNENDKDCFTPNNFKTTIGLIDDRYSDYNQQDTHEFMTFLIDSLHEDLNKVINKPIIKRKDSEYNNYISNEKSDDKQSIIEWNNFLKRNQSIMVDLFYGQYKSTILCPHCEHKSINFSIYLNLQLPIPKYKENYIIKFGFSEEGPNNFPPVKLSIILNNQNNKTSEVKKIIGNIFEISPNEIEIIKYRGKEIIKVFEDEEEIIESTNFFNAVKINSRTKKGNSLYDSNIIDYSNLKEKIENKKDELIHYFENVTNLNNDSNNDLELNITIDINDNISSNENNFEKFIIKHYYLSEEINSNDLINKDYIIYLETNKSYYDIYYKIFDIYFEIIIEHYLQLSNNKKQENYNDEEHKKKMFEMFFKDFTDKENKFSNDVFEKYKDLPFILKLGDFHNKNNIFIPPLKNYIFKDFQSNINNNDNKKEENNYDNNNLIEVDIEEKTKEVNIQEDELNFSGICNNGGNDDQMSNNDFKLVGNNNTLYLKNKEGQIMQVNENQNQIIFEEKEKEVSIQIPVHESNQEKNTEEINDKIKSIIIIWNVKFIKKKEINNGEYYLTKNLSSETINLYSFFQKIFDDHFQNILIEECFKEFCKEETFDKDNLWKCSKCHENIEAKNKIEIYQTPKILIIQLKRFKNNQKIESFIDFPIKDLDISKFITSPTGTENVHSKKYNLFAVVNHYGRLEYGHYDAFCLNYDDNCWYNFNDSIVKKINKEDEINKIVTKDAYVLFYRQQNIDTIDWDKIYKKNFVDLNDHNMKTFDEDFLYQKIINHTKNSKDFIGINWDNIFTQSTNATVSTLKQNDKEDDNDNEELYSSDDLSLNSFIYNPFGKKKYLNIKRHRLDKKKQKIS